VSSQALGPLSRVAFAGMWVFVASVPLDVIPVAGFGSLSRYLGPVVLGLVLLAVIERGSVVRWGPVHAMALAFVGWATATVFWSVDAEASVSRLFTFAQLAAFMAAFHQVPRRRDDVEAFAVAFVTGTYVVASAQIISFVRGAGFWADESRFAGLGYDPNDLGVTLAIALPLAWFAGLQRRGGIRLALLGYVPVALVAIALTGSRGASATAVVACSAIPLSIARLSLSAKIALCVLGAGCAFTLSVVVPPESWLRIASIGDEVSSGEIGNRARIWQAGWEVLRAHWFTGVGVGAFPAAVQPALNVAWVAHNTPLSVAAETGIVGFGLLYGMFAMVGAEAARCSPLHKRLIWSLVATWLVGTISLTWEFRKPTWLILALSLTVLRFAARRSRVT
jgi:O-antigen ligase